MGTRHSFYPLSVCIIISFRLVPKPAPFRLHGIESLGTRLTSFGISAYETEVTHFLVRHIALLEQLEVLNSVGNVEGYMHRCLLQH